MKSNYGFDVERVKKILLNSDHAVFFGGAGVSTDSGIPDFRGNGGLYDSKDESNEYYLSSECLKDEPEKFFRFFRKNMVFENAKPNGAHCALAALEKRGVIKAVITQNIDGLHQKAGSERVIELHGASNRCYCTKCGRVFDNSIITSNNDIPCCDKCGSLVRPDVTLYGEALDGFNFADARREISESDVLVVGGSFLVVNPAASLIGAFRGEHLIIINYMPTPYDEVAEYVIRDSISDMLSCFAKQCDK